jgi:hypothetical protein
MIELETHAAECTGLSSNPPSPQQEQASSAAEEEEDKQEAAQAYTHCCVVCRASFKDVDGLRKHLNDHISKPKKKKTPCQDPEDESPAPDNKPKPSKSKPIETAPAPKKRPKSSKPQPKENVPVPKKQKRKSSSEEEEHAPRPVRKVANKVVIPRSLSEDEIDPFMLPAEDASLAPMEGCPMCARADFSSPDELQRHAAECCGGGEPVELASTTTTSPTTTAGRARSSRVPPTDTTKQHMLDQARRLFRFSIS